MSTQSTGAPPQAPPQGFGGGGGDGEPVGRAVVTRNVPPKRVMVQPGNTVTYAGRSYGEGDSFVMGEGAAADGLALAGHVIIVEHEAIDAWNGEEGDDHRRSAHRLIDANHEQFTPGQARDHDHGFTRYEAVDGEGAIPVDLTMHRQQLAQDHLLRGEQMDDSHAKPRRRGGR